MHHSTRGSSVAGSLAALILFSLFLCSCATTGGGKGGGDGALAASESSTSEAVADVDGEGKTFLGIPVHESTAPAKNHSWIQDSPPSAAIEPHNWLAYSAYYLGEILLAPIRIVQMIFDGA